MYEVKVKITKEEFGKFEFLMFETESLQNWNLYENFDDKGYWLQGIFETDEEAWDSWRSAAHEVEDLAQPEIKKLEDEDWKESYKDHFKPWSIGKLHWVPQWLKGSHELEEGEEAVWLDPGMAFGTGNHATTRLCVEQLIAYKAQCRDTAEARIVDAGCGSGILAISASKLGFEKIAGFDIDGEAVRIAVENAESNQVSNTNFFVGDLGRGLSEAGADCLMANILANVLVANAEQIRNSVASGGWLILSGILGSEVEEVKAHFESMGGLRDGVITLMDEWSAIRFIKD
ncbi:MAG: 50S ribosomal protein L11 methyltransferase [Verrucomicrobiota bacterium]